MKYKRISAVFLALSVFTEMFVYSAFSSDKNIVAYKVEHDISPGLKYINTVEVCEGVRQEIFTFEFSPGNNTAIIPAYGQYIYGFNSVGNLISSYDGDGRVVGGINTDFFITNTGIPLSCLVAEKEVITSCDDRVALGFDNNGNAVIGNPSIKGELVRLENGSVIPVAHINKTPGIWGLYLVSDKFSNTTRSTVESTEIVLKPLTDITISSSNDSEEILQNDVNLSDTFGYYSPSYIFDDINDHIDEINDQINDSDVKNQEHNNEDVATDINDENKHIGNSDNNEMFGSDGLLRIGDKVKTIVTEIRINSTNSPIPEGCYVACIPNENFSYLADGIDVGDEIIIDVSYNEEIFSECTNIFGAGSKIISNGEFVEQSSDTIYKYRNPRTAAGIKEDGTVVFVCVDGRKSGVSVGYTIKELADYLISHGCIDAVNFDGGGSTTFYAADLGELNASLKNAPSDGVERRVADGLIFVNTAESDGKVAASSLYPSNYYVYNSGVNISIDGKVLFADSSYYPVIFSDENYTMAVDDEFGILNQNIFTSNGSAGVAPIYVIKDEKRLKAGNIIITDIVDELNFSSDKTTLTPFENFASLSISASLNTIPIAVTGNSAEITILINDNTSDESFKVADSSEAYIDRDNFSFVPIKRGVTYRIMSSLGGVTASADIIVEEYPFYDMENHWGALTAYDMFKEGVFIGEFNVDGQRLFMPERNMSKAEFCMVLARILGLETEYVPVVEKETNHTDETEYLNYKNIKVDEILNTVPDWAKGCIYSLYTEGYIDSLITKDQDDNDIFIYDQYITRMDVIRVLGHILSINKKTGDDDFDELPFLDFVHESEEDIQYLNYMYNFGIINGFEDGTLRQNTNLTRSQAAAVFSRYILAAK